jgi:diguanylate cyclase
LIEVARRLAATARRGDTVARFGGDQLAVLIEDGGDAVQAAPPLLATIEHPVAIGDDVVNVGASIGVITLAPGELTFTPSEMLHGADLAMYAAKTDGKGTVRSYSPELTGIEPSRV